MSSAHESRREYLARVNRVIDYIERNLHRRLSLDELADVACFSRYHFHRIFGAVVGETLNQFVQRLRVERAATVLVAAPEKSITAVALDCGFSSPSTFARAFKDAFGMSASQWRQSGCSAASAPNRKIRKALRKLGEAASGLVCQIDPQTQNPTWRFEMTMDEGTLRAAVEVEERTALNVVYVRHVGPYGQTALVPQLVEKLRRWASPRGLAGPDARLLLVPHDSPTITEPEKLRLSVCLTAPEGTRGEGEVGTMKIPGGRFAVGRFEIPPAQIASAWHALLGGWLPESGYQPDDRFSYEEVLQSPAEHPEGKIRLAICVPVRPL